MSKSTNKPWEEWQLTAFVLNELDAETAQTISAAAAENASLSAEITDIRQTLKQANQVFRAESLDGLATGSLTGSVADGDSPRSVSPAGIHGTGKRRAALRPRLVWLGIVGSAAALILALLVTAPLISDWNMASATKSDSDPGDPLETSTAPARPTDELQELAGGKKELEQPADESSRIESLATMDSSLLRSTEEYKPTENLSQIDPVASTRQMTTELEAKSEQIAQSGGAPSPVNSGYGGEGGYGGNMGGGGMALGYGGGGYGGGGYGNDASGGYGGGMGGYGAPSSGLAGGGGYGGDAFSAGNSVDYGVTPDSLSRSNAPAPGAEAHSAGDYYGLAGDDLDVQPPQPAAPASLPALSAPADARGMQLAKNRQPQSELSTASDDFLHSESRRRSHAPGIGGRGIGGPGMEPGHVGDRFEATVENRFESVAEAPLSTFSIDVDSASYTKCRQLLLEAGRRPPAAAVRIEEFINYFDYEYAGPQGDDPFGAHLAVANCPWEPQHKLVRIALQATKLEMADRPQANIVFLLDVSGSMNEPNKLPLVKESMQMLVNQLGENDKIAMAVYAGAAGCVLEGTRGDQQAKILGAIENLKAGGSTNGGQGIQLAYNLARDNFIPGGINRVILCTDGDFNVGVTGTDALVKLVEDNAKSKIFLTVLGYGMGNTNDAMMEQISNRGNGVYGFVDTRREAHRQMVKQLAGNLMTVAKDVKIQVEFNPQKVGSYRLIGYENRMLAAEDFNNDKKDAGEIGAGHRVTALYEVVPVAQGKDAKPEVDALRYQPSPSNDLFGHPPQPEPAADSEHSDELLAVKLRYKQPEGDTSRLLVFPLKDRELAFSETDRDFQWAASVAQFAMLLRQSSYSGQSSWQSVLEQATAAAGVNPNASQQECLEMIRRCLR